MNPDFTWLPLNKGVRIIASHECGIFALDKPAGIMTHPNSSGVANAKNAMLVADYSLEKECYFCRGDDGVVRRIFVLNRLDSPTSGIVLCSSDAVTAQLVRQAFIADHVKKTYFAIVCGDPQKNVWRDWLIREKTSDGSLRMKIAVHSGLRGAQYAETEIGPAGTKNQNSAFHLVKLSPHTGRTHQLRVQCAAHGFPILGDRAYGDSENNKRVSEMNVPAARNRLFLHAGATSVKFVWRGKEIDFSATSQLPNVFQEIVSCNSAKSQPHETTAPTSRFRVRIKRA